MQIDFSESVLRCSSTILFGVFFLFLFFPVTLVLWKCFVSMWNNKKKQIALRYRKFAPPSENAPPRSFFFSVFLRFRTAHGFGFQRLFRSLVSAPSRSSRAGRLAKACAPPRPREAATCIPGRRPHHTGNAAAATESGTGLMVMLTVQLRSSVRTRASSA